MIGANGAGKSTFLKLLSGELDSTKGTISIKPGLRMSVLKQDQFRYDAYTILDTVIMGNQRLYDIMKQKDALYAKPDFSDEDGLLASELETEFAELNGWEAESDASRILQGLGVPVELHNDRMPTPTAVSRSRSCWRRPCSVSRTLSCSTSQRTTSILSPSTGWKISSWTTRTTALSSS